MKKVYNSKFVKVYLENFRYKKKLIKNYHKVVFKNVSMVVLENKNGEVLLIKEYRRALKKEIYGFPGGHIENKEKPLVAAKRELHEETGLKAKSWKHLFSYINSGTYNCGYEHIFIAKVASNQKLLKISQKKKNLKWVNKKDLKKVFLNKNLIPAGLIAVFFYYINHKNKND